MNNQTRAAQVFNIVIGESVSRSVYQFTGDVSIDSINVLVSEGKVEWQDPKSPDCGNADGVLYVYLPFIDAENEDDASEELFIGINVAAGHICF